MIHTKSIQKSASKEHQEVVEFCAKYFKGEMVVIKGNIKGKYFPDVRTLDADIECERAVKSQHILDKAKKWDDKKEKILVLWLPKEIEILFDEIYLYTDKQLVDVKWRALNQNHEEMYPDPMAVFLRSAAEESEDLK